MVFQRPVLLQRSLMANIFYPIKLARISVVDRQAYSMQVFQRVGLAQRAADSARLLSGGEQQRLALARAWACRPKILILDEPTSHLDPSAVREVEAIITAMHADGVTVIMSTHNLGQAKRLADDIVFLHQGRIEEVCAGTMLFNQLRVRVVAVGTGQALDIAKRADADLVLVHDRELEDRFVAEGFGVDRRDIMYNDFVLIGPNADPARARGTGSVAQAFKRIAETQSTFVSRGDRSGTHAAELRYWAMTDLITPTKTQPRYRDVGAGMGQTLNLASGLNGYTLAARGSWIAFKNRGELRIVLEGDPTLRNNYGAILVSPARHPHVKIAYARGFLDWLVSVDGQRQIAVFRIADEQLFFPSAAKSP